MPDLKNPSFEGSWWRKTHVGQEFGEIFVPEKWTAYWKEGPPVPHDPTNTGGYGRPEMHVINKEPPFLTPPRIYDGTRSLKFFTFYRIHDAGLYQQVPGFTLGDRVKVTGWAHAWSSTRDDAFTSDTDGDGAENFTFRVGIDPYGGTDPWSDAIVWGPGAHIYDTFEQIPPVEVSALAETITVFVRSSVLWPFKHCDAYIDGMELTVTNVVPEPPTDYGYPVIAKGSKLHPHAIGEGGTYDMLNLLRQENCELPIFKFVATKPDQLPGIRNLKAIMPNAMVIARFIETQNGDYNLQGMPDNAGRYMSEILPYMDEYRDVVDWWELWNENDPVGEDGHVAMANMSIDCMDIAEEHGHKLALMSYSLGVPEFEEYEAIWNRTEFFRRAKGGGHILSVHEYEWFPDGMGHILFRTDRLYNEILIPNDCVVPYVATEYNVPNNSGPPNEMDAETLKHQWRSWDNEAGKRYFCLGGSVYTLGQIEDDYYFNDYWRDIADVILDARNRVNALPAITPPVVPPEDCPAPRDEWTTRVSVLVRFGANDQAWADASAYANAPDNQHSIGRSWDHAFWSPGLERVVIKLWYDVPNAFDINEITAWGREHYPTINVEFVKVGPLADHESGVIPFSQGDESWKDIRLGESEFTMQQSGCVVTSYASLFSMIDDTMNPKKLVTWLNNNNGFTSPRDRLPGGLLYMSKPFDMPGITEHLRYVRYHTWRTGGAADLSLIEKLLEVGPTVIQVDFLPATEPLDSHFVLGLRLIGDDMEIMDPWTGQICNLIETYGDGRPLELCIFAAVEYAYRNPPPEEPLLVAINDPENVGAGSWMVDNRSHGAVVIPLSFPGAPVTLDFRNLADCGIEVGINARWSWSTDCGGMGALPPLDSEEGARFIDTVVATINSSKGVAWWTIGNEINNPREWPRGHTYTPLEFAIMYNVIRSRVSAKMAPGALDPFHASAGDPRLWQTIIFGNITGADFIAAHGYSRGPNPDMIGSPAKFTDNPMKWQYLNFPGCVTELARFLPDQYKHLAIYVLECNHLWRDGGEAAGDYGWVMDERAASVVRKACEATLGTRIKLLAFYRWTSDAWAIHNNPFVLGAIKDL